MPKRTTETSPASAEGRLDAKRMCVQQVRIRQISQASGFPSASETARVSAQRSEPPRPCPVLMAGKPLDKFGDADFVKLYAGTLQQLGEEALSAFFSACVGLREMQTQLTDAWVRANMDGGVGLGSDKVEEIALSEASKEVFCKALEVTQLQTQLSSAQLDRAAALKNHAKAVQDLLDARQRSEDV